uniref:Uncharacterized protein n=1 Tax=Auxenochlorella protothecoides TaxID=3075 RepID=A0A1D2AAB2_AUXPR
MLSERCAGPAPPPHHPSPVGGGGRGGGADGAAGQGGACLPAAHVPPGAQCLPSGGPAALPARQAPSTEVRGPGGSARRRPRAAPRSGGPAGGGCVADGARGLGAGGAGAGAAADPGAVHLPGARHGGRPAAAAGGGGGPPAAPGLPGAPLPGLRLRRSKPPHPTPSARAQRRGVGARAFGAGRPAGEQRRRRVWRRRRRRRRALARPADPPGPRPGAQPARRGWRGAGRGRLLPRVVGGAHPARHPGPAAPGRLPGGQRGDGGPGAAVHAGPLRRRGLVRRSGGPACFARSRGVTVGRLEEGVAPALRRPEDRGAQGSDAACAAPASPTAPAARQVSPGRATALRAQRTPRRATATFPTPRTPPEHAAPDAGGPCSCCARPRRPCGHGPRPCLGSWPRSRGSPWPHTPHCSSTPWGADASRSLPCWTARALARGLPRRSPCCGWSRTCAVHWGGTSWQPGPPGWALAWPPCRSA